MAAIWETWQESPEALQVRTRMTEQFSEMSDHHLAQQAAAILEVDQMERGTIPNSTPVGDNRVAFVCKALLSEPLKPSGAQAFFEKGRTRIGREACVDEFLSRVIAAHADKFGYAKVEEDRTDG